MSEEPRIVRRHVRVPLGADSPFSSEIWPDGTTPVRGTIRILGTGGACIEVSEAIAVGCPMSLSFTLPGTNEQIVCGAVVRNKLAGNELSIEFFLMTPSDRNRLKSAVMQRCLLDS